MIAIVKPVGNYCNLRCSYCFYNDQEQAVRELIADDILQELFAGMSQVSEQPTFIWHGGEPLLAGMDFYRRVIVLQKKHFPSREVHNLIQTNATLITNKWAIFLKESGFRVGVSLDGCPQQHDTHRHTVANKGSHGHAMKGIHKLEEHGVSYGMIQTVTATTLDQVEESTRFIHSELRSKRLALNVFHADDAARGWALENRVTDKQWADYMEVVFQIWNELNDPDFTIREVEAAIQGVVGKRVRACRFNGSCGHYMCVELDGSVYPCDRFMNPENCWGNLLESDFNTILGSESRKRFLEQNELSYQHCSGCKWFGACHNGCGAQRVGGLSGSFYYCGTSKRLMEMASKAIRETLKGGG